MVGLVFVGRKGHKRGSVVVCCGRWPHSLLPVGLVGEGLNVSLSEMGEMEVSMCLCTHVHSPVIVLCAHGHTRHVFCILMYMCLILYVHLHVFNCE